MVLSHLVKEFFESHGDGVSFERDSALNVDVDDLSHLVELLVFR